MLNVFLLRLCQLLLQIGNQKIILQLRNFPVNIRVFAFLVAAVEVWALGLWWIFRLIGAVWGGFLTQGSLRSAMRANRSFSQDSTVFINLFLILNYCYLFLLPQKDLVWSKFRALLIAVLDWASWWVEETYGLLIMEFFVGRDFGIRWSFNMSWWLVLEVRSPFILSRADAASVVNFVKILLFITSWLLWLRLHY